MHIHSLVEHELLSANQLKPADFAHALALIGRHDVDYADIYCQRTAYESWHLEEGMVKSGSFQIDQGVGVRAVSGDKTAFAYADNLTASALNEAAAAVRAIGQAGQARHVAVAPAATAMPLYVAENPIASLDEIYGLSEALIEATKRVA